MKTNAWWVIAVLFCATQFLQAQAPQDTALVKAKVVNVRGQPSIFSEVITQLKEGDTVTILDEINVEKPKPEDVAKWYRIQMPANTPVWVSTHFIDTNSVVKARRLNVRAGPGENYSVVGMLNQGDTIKEIRRKENWIEIEPFEKAYAFVAAELVEKRGEPVAAAPAKNSEPLPTIVEPSKVAPEPGITKAPNRPATNQQETILPPAPLIAAEPARPAPTPSTNVNLPPILATPPELNRAPIDTKLSSTAPPAPKKRVDPLPRRVVVREGVVRGTISIQAPTDFLLESPYNGVAMNFLYPTSTNLVLKNFRGKRVVVSGEEALDERWPNTPVLKVESLKPAPSSKGE